MFFAKRFRVGQIPAKFPYELRENAKFYDNWENDDTLREATARDVIRIFSRKEITLKPDDEEAVSSYIESKVKNADTMREIADELILAQWISSVMIQGGDDVEVQN